MSVNASLPPWLDAPALALTRLHQRGVHATLLHGPAGTGKWNLAMAFARHLLCQNPTPPAGACGVCGSCLLFAAGNHADLKIVVPDALAERRLVRPTDDDTVASPVSDSAASKAKPSSEIKIDAVRELSRLFQISAQRGGYRVVVLGPAESLNLPAANALLKNLEEPPDSTRFILVSDRLDGCLPTVLSRCSLVRVTPPASPDALRWLTQEGVPAAKAQRLLVLVGGAPMAAWQHFTNGSSPEDNDAILALLRAGPSLQSAQVVAQVPRQIELPLALTVMQRWAWDAQAVALGANARYFPDDTETLRRLTASLPDWHRLNAWQRHLDALKATSEHPLNVKSCLEGALLQYRDIWQTESA